MRKRRIIGYIIDLFIMAICLSLIYVIIPKSKEIKLLEQDNSSLRQEYFENDITFNQYVKGYTKNIYEIRSKELKQTYLYIGLLIIYFVILPSIWKGRTIGSYISKLQIENFRDGKAKWYQFLIRAIIINGLGYVLFSLLFTMILKGNSYFIGISILTIIQLLLLLICCFWIVIKKESRGLHGILSGTEIVKIINGGLHEKNY